MNEQPASPEAPPARLSVTSPEERLAGLYPDDTPGASAVETSEIEDEPADEDAARATSSPDTPASYELAAPDGYDLDPELLTEVTPVLREAGLSNEQANQLLPIAGKIIDRHIDAVEDEFSAMKTAWAKRTMADRELGGDNWSQTKQLMDTAFAYLGFGRDHELRQLLNQTGLGNHPSMIRAFRHFGRLVERSRSGNQREDMADRTRGRSGPRHHHTDRLDALYPDARPRPADAGIRAWSKRQRDRLAGIYPNDKEK